MYFTHKEKTVARHHKSFALKQAEDVLKNKGVFQLCTTAFHASKEMLTTEEVSRLVEDIVWDSSIRW